MTERHGEHGQHSCTVTDVRPASRACTLDVESVEDMSAGELECARLNVRGVVWCRQSAREAAQKYLADGDLSKPWPP